MDLLEIVLINNYVTYDGMHYYQVVGCAVGSPVSAVIANLVMGNIEDRALSTSPVTPCWWRGYVNDSNVCLKKMDVQVFLQHLNYIDSNIQFTIESARQTDKGRSISFLDSQVTVLSDSSKEIDAFRKKTHTNKYLDFASHNPMQHKEAVVKTLLNRANLLPSHPELKTDENDLVMDDTRANWCHDCSFTYIGKNKRSWSSRGAARDPGRASNSESAINNMLSQRNTTSIRRTPRFLSVV